MGESDRDYLLDWLRGDADNTDPRAALCAEAAEELRRHRWRLHQRLIAPCFSENPRPELLDIWEREAPVYTARRFAFEDFEEAVAFMLGSIPRGADATTDAARRSPAPLAAREG